MRSFSFFATLALIAFTGFEVLAQANAGPDTLICDGPAIMQGSAVPLGGSGTWTLIAGCGNIVDPSSPTTTINGLCPGLNSFTWEVNDGGSISVDTVDVGVVDLPTIPDAGPDQTIIGPPFTAQLAANTPIFPSTCVCGRS